MATQVEKQPQYAALWLLFLSVRHQYSGVYILYIIYSALSKTKQNKKEYTQIPNVKTLLFFQQSTCYFIMIDDG